MDGNDSHARFAPTRWSLVRRARRVDDAGRRALSELCALYWAPVYAFFRRDGMAAHDARDLTQGLFAELLEREDLAGGDPDAGRFRSWLLACARHYRSNERDRARAQKRGGDVTHVPIKVAAEPVGVEAAAAGETPEQAYLRAWVRSAVDAAIADLDAQERGKGRGDWFVRLAPALEGEGLPGGYAAAAVELGATEAAVKVAVHRLRRRFRTALLAQLGATLDDPAEAGRELDELFRALG